MLNKKNETLSYLCHTESHLSIKSIHIEIYIIKDIKQITKGVSGAILLVEFGISAYVVWAERCQSEMVFCCSLPG